MSTLSRRNTKELLLATLPFTQESRARSWRETVVSFVALGLAVAGASLPRAWPVRLCFSVVEGLVVVRCFGLYHDALHGSLFRGSKLGEALFGAFGVLVLTPPKIWRQTHNYHHAHTAKLVGSNVGSFPTVNLAMWRSMSWRERLKYRIARHPLTVLSGYLTVFLIGMCLGPFLRRPRAFWDSGLALLVHGALVGLLWRGGGPSLVLFALVLPLVVACAAGSYLFYAQHNYPTIEIQPREHWTYSAAALRSSSYIRMGRLARWFTANLGFHHVHHLNPAIAFYRLPDAMAALPELQEPHVTSLRLRDVRACLALDVWDEAAGQMVSFRH